MSIIGCGPGLRSMPRNQSQSASDDAIDAYYIDDNETTEEQLELDLGDRPETQPETQPEEQIELQLEEEIKTEDEKTVDKEESKKDGNGIQTLKSDLGRAQLLKPTVYYLPSNDTSPFRSCRADDTRSFKAKKGQTILSGKTEIKVCSKFYYAVQMQGSGLVRTRDNRQYLINYVGAEDGVPRFKIIDRDVCPYGLGMANLCLQPFVSIAADRNRYKLGDVIYVPEVFNAKITLPDGNLHQGYFIVTDTGAAITGVGRFDFYTGPMHYSDPANPFVKIGLQSKANRAGLKYQQVERNSNTARKVLEYYKGRQIIPYTK